MEIDFNTARISKPELNSPVARRISSVAASGVEGTEPAEVTRALLDKINGLPDLRPEQVAAAKERVRFTTYPPVELLNRIANLLAVHLHE